jgi:hypothetical protein
MIMKKLIPTRSLILLMGIGFVDLVFTAVLHAKGLIVEMNPLMRLFIEKSEWLFALVKCISLLCAWVALAWYAKTNVKFVRQACLWGSGAYVFVWTSWFLAAR